MTTTVTVTIGRNVGVRPMSADTWNTFVAKTREAVEAVTNGELWAKGPGRSEWQGVVEDSFVFYGPVWSELDQPLHLGGDRTPEAIAVLRATLAVLATYYGQDAIGLSVGTSELVERFASYGSVADWENNLSPAELDHVGESL